MKNRRFWFNIIFVAVLVLVIALVFRGSWHSIINQLAKTAPTVLVLIAVSSVIYHLFEAWITCSLARQYNPRFHYGNAIHCAFLCSFYRLSTVGTGTGVAAVVFLGKKGVGYSEAAGLYMIQYMLHRVSIAIFSGVFFLVNWNIMAHYYKNYAVYLILAYLLTVAISVVLILLATYPGFHRCILWILQRFNRRHRLDHALEELEKNAALMAESTSKLLKNARQIAACILKNLAKLCFWYCIPFLILYQTGEIHLLSSFSITSLSVMTAAVIPTPVGIGSTELIMTGLYSVLIGVDKATAVTLLYRIATFIFPFVVGSGFVIGGRVLGRAHS